VLRKFSQWATLSLVAVLALSACSGLIPVALDSQTLIEEPTQSRMGEVDPTVAAAPPTSSILLTTEEAPKATPASSKILAHPQGCSPASLSKSVLMYTWSDRQSEHLLFPVDASTGQPLCAYEPISLGYQFMHSFSPDGNLLALTVSDREDGRNSALEWIDLKNWQLIKSPIEFEDWITAIAYSPDGQKLAITATGAISEQGSASDSSQVAVIDNVSQTLQAERAVDLSPTMLEFTRDGSALVVYGSAKNPDDQTSQVAQVALLDSTTLEPLWSAPLAGVIYGNKPVEESEDDPEGFESWEPAIVYAPDQEALYIVHADSNRLTTVDINARTIHSADILTATSWLERLLTLTAGTAHAKTLDGHFKTAVLSPDGSRLYILSRTADSFQDEDGNWQFSETSHGLDVVEVATAAQLVHLNTDATDLEFSADGQSLFLRSWMDQGWTEVLDENSLSTIAHLAGRHITRGRQLDGQPVLLSTIYHENGQTTMAIIDPDTHEDIYVGWTVLWASWLIK
jgi:DNA-binding beta-propeller fold protein YncE